VSRRGRAAPWRHRRPRAPYPRRDDRGRGFFTAPGYTSNVSPEIDRLFRKSGKVIVALTVREILGEELANKVG